MTSAFDQQVQEFSVPAPADIYSQARNIALRSLSQSAKSRKELATKLAKRDIPDQTIDQVLDDLSEIGLVDDLAFAHLLVRSRCATKKISRSRLSLQLKAKGIAPEYIALALAQVSDQQQEQMAFDVAEKKVRQLSRYSPEVIERRTYQLLLRKGYSFGLATKVVRHVMQEVQQS